MTTQDGKGEPQEHRDFFISYTSNDLQWAKWIANQLNDAGYTYILDKRDFQPGSNFLIEMNNATKSCDRTLVVLSPDYSQSEFTTLEWIATLRKDPTGARRCLLPVRVKDFRVDGLLGAITYIDLVSCDEDEAKKRLLAGVPLEPAKHEEKVPYPGPQSHTSVPFPGSLPIHWNIPPHNPFFTGRDKLLKDLHSRLQIGHHKQVISGMTGIGKTQIAIEYAHMYRQEYEFILRANAESLETLNTAYNQIAALLKLSEHDAQEQDRVIEAVKMELQKRTNWLLILDNVDEALYNAHKEHYLTAFLPEHPHGHILVTTQAASLSHLDLGFEHSVPVEGFSPDEGIHFLLKRARVLQEADGSSRQPSAHEITQAKKIGQEMEWHPLALNQAGVYITTCGCGLDSYLRSYQRQRTKLLNECRHKFDGRKSVATALSLSLERVELDAAAMDLLNLCATLAPGAIPEKILITGGPSLGSELAQIAADERRLDEIVQNLLTYSLIRRNSENHTLSIHQLVRAVLFDMMEDQQRQIWQRRAVLALEATCPEDVEDVKHWAIYEQLLPHASEYAKVPEEQIEALGKDVALIAARLFFKMGNYSYKRAQYTEAEVFYQHSRKIREDLLEPDNLDIAYSQRGLSNTYSELGRYADAKKWCESSKAIFEQKLEVTHSDRVSSLNNLAILSKVQAEPEKAEELYIHSLTIRMQSLLTSFEAQGRPEEATNMFYTRCLDTQVQSLAAFLKMPEEPEQAIKRYIRFLLNEKTAVRKFAQVLNNLAVLYAEQPVKYGAARQRLRKYETAERLFHLSLWLQKQHLEHDTPEMENDPGCYDSDYALSLNDLANLYTEWGSNPEVPPDTRCTLYEMAASLYRDSMDILENRHNGVNHPDIAYPFHGQGILDFEQGRYEEAEEWYQKSLDIWEKYLQPDHPQIAYALYNLANLYFEQGKQAEAEAQYQRHFYAMAEERYEKSLGIWKERLGRWHLHTRTCAKKYVKLLRILNKDAKAQRIEKDFGV